MQTQRIVLEPRAIDRLRHRHPESGFVAGISRNHGTADGLHARCLAALQRSDAGREPDRGVFAAEYAAALERLPRGVRKERHRPAAAGCATRNTAANRTAANRAACSRHAARTAAAGPAQAYMMTTNRPALLAGGVLADIDPFRRCQFGHPRRRDLDRAVGRACGRHHHVERLQRHIAIDRQRRLQSERTDAADLVAGDLGDLVAAPASSACRRTAPSPSCCPSARCRWRRSAPRARRSASESVFAIRAGSTP